jgi:FtsP/CotA-like multicopper oxidase with cupredoxin domain
MPTRRSVLAATAGGALAALSPFLPARATGRPLGPAPEPAAGRTVEIDLVAAERPRALPCFGGRELPLWTLSPETPLPIVRLSLGDRLRARLTNELPRAGEHTSIHWHGIRLPIDQDGVPFVSQLPVETPGGSFTYDFVPPDTGSFFFHTHCNAVEQLGRGLAGLLIVEGDETEPYDGEVVLAVRDWRIAETGGFLPFLTDKGAGTTGSFGTVRSTNGETSPTVAVPATADVRVRLYNVDPTRILEVGLEGAEAAVIAIDGNAVTPFPLKSWRLGSAMRIDLVLRTPAAGRTATLYDYRVAEPYPLAVFAAGGEAVRAATFDPAPLRRPRVPEPDLANATRLTFEYASTAAGTALAATREQFPGIDDLCLSDRTFWAINKTSWPADGHNRLPPPLALLETGRTYVLELFNASKQFHPIHIHGHTFTVLSSTKQDLPRHLADTVLLVPRERLEVAFVADNPGDWMFHCHLIEHQETGMMGYVRVA